MIPHENAEVPEAVHDIQEQHEDVEGSQTQPDSEVDFPLARDSPQGSYIPAVDDNVGLPPDSQTSRANGNVTPTRDHENRDYSQSQCVSSSVSGSSEESQESSCSSLFPWVEVNNLVAMFKKPRSPDE